MPLPTEPAILIVTGLRAEARIASGLRTVTVAGGGDRPGLARRLASYDDRRLTAVVSFGVAGGLEPRLPVGAVVLGTEVHLAPALGSGRRVPANHGPLLPRVATRLAEQLLSKGIDVRVGAIAGVDQPAASVDDKRALYAASGALVVDMESHVAADYAARRGLPFLAIRVVSDGAADAIPTAAAGAMRPDGSVHILGLLGALAREPGQIPGLLATARNAAVAFRRLRRVRRLLGDGLGLHL